MTRQCLTASSSINFGRYLEKLRRSRIPYRDEDLFWFYRGRERSGLEAARWIVHLLEKMGHEVLTRHLVDDDAWEADRRISAPEVYQRDMAWLGQCDIFIAEVSGSSFGLGFEAGYVLGSTQKRVILLYRRDLEEKLSLLIRENSHANCTLMPYTNAEEVDQFIPGILMNAD